MRKYQLYAVLLVMLVPPNHCQNVSHVIFDCTDVINDLLQNPDSSESTAMLGKVLNETPTIFYSVEEPITSIFPDKLSTIVKILDGMGWKLGTRRGDMVLSIMLKFGTNILDSEHRNITKDELIALLRATTNRLQKSYNITSVEIQVVLSYVSEKTCKIPHVLTQIKDALHDWRFSRFLVGGVHNYDQVRCVVAGYPWTSFRVRVVPIEFIPGYRFPESYELFEEYINDNRKRIESNLQPHQNVKHKLVFKINMHIAPKNSGVQTSFNKITETYFILLSRFAYKWSTENRHGVIIKLSKETFFNYVLPVEEIISAIEDNVFPYLQHWPSCPTPSKLHTVANGRFKTFVINPKTFEDLRKCWSNFSTSDGPGPVISNNSFPQMIVNFMDHRGFSKEERTHNNRALLNELNQQDTILDASIWPVVSSETLNPEKTSLTRLEKKELVFGLKKISKEIGCHISLEVFNADPLSTNRFRRNASAIAELIVNECQLGAVLQFHLVILQLVDLLRFDFKVVGVDTEGPYYMTHVQPQLYEIYLANNLLKERFPYIKLILNLPLREAIGSVFETSGQLYCDEKSRKENQYVEAFIAWSYIHNISIIVKQFFSRQSWNPGWFYEIKGSQNRKYDSTYLLRNYPKTMGYLDPHPCLLPPERPVNSRIQLNPNGMGCRFNLLVSGEDQFLTSREFQTQLQFVFSTFSKVEINGTDINKLIHKLELLPSIIPNQTQIFVDLPLSTFTLNSAENHIRKLSSLRNKLELEEILVNFNIQLSEWEGLHEDEDLLKNLQKVVNFADSNRIGLGIVLKTCSKARWYEGEILNSKILSLSFSYLTCEEPWNTTFAADHADHYTFAYHLDRFLDEMYATKLVLENKLSVKQFYFRFEISRYTRTDYLKFIRLFNKHAELYNMTYFGIKAFEVEELGENRTERDNGWWRIQRGRDISDVYNYVELESDYLRQPTQRPKAIPEELAKEGTWWQITVPLAVFLAIFFFIFFASWKMLRSTILTKEEEREFLQGTTQDSGSYNYLNMKYNPNLEIPKMSTYSEACTIIGAGNFGTVYKALLKGRWVALKVPNEGCSKELFRTTLQEIKILCYLGTHENILGFIGAYIKEIRRGVVQIATELCENGTLLEHLRNLNRSVAATKRGVCNYELVAPFDLERFCFEIAVGMDYLTFKQIIHGDLATRNVLLDEHFTCKIGDFGLSRKLYEYEQYVKESQEPLPWRWVAPEGLRKMEFSAKSDVWSYGVTLWEIYSLGDVPYPGLNWKVNFVDDLENGLRLQKPMYSPESTYGKLLECWNIEAGARPTFFELTQFFQDLRQKLYATFLDYR